jgi:molybdopterin/thiamine biosynthesis adenylyltransferase/rhodanese-related sulfurtransferase
MADFQTFLREVKSQIRECTIQEVREAPGMLVDVREVDEWQEGHLPGATWVPRGRLELRIEDLVPERATPLTLYCAGGNRSALAAASLKQLGYTNVRSMIGGFTAWKRAGYPYERPVVLTPSQKERYARHLIVPEVGEAGQAKLLRSKLLLIGVGGLGSPAALYLAAAGIGTMGIIDDDVVDASNLQRQVIHTTARVGKPKVDSASEAVQALNPDVKVVPIRERLCRENALEILGRYDLVVDGADNFQARYLLNDACVKLRKPFVHASIFRFEGQLTTFVPYEGPCYRCLYPEPPPPDMAPSCQEAGVLGVLPGVIGVLQAVEAIKLVLGVGQPLTGRLLTYDALKARFRELTLRKSPACPVCSDPDKPIELIDYDEFCNVGRGM